MRFALTGGQASNRPQAIPLLEGIETSAVIAGKGYQSNRTLAFISSTGATAEIPPKSKSNRKEPWEYDRELLRQGTLQRTEPGRAGIQQTEALARDSHPV